MSSYILKDMLIKVQLTLERGLNGALDSFCNG